MRWCSLSLGLLALVTLAWAKAKPKDVDDGPHDSPESSSDRHRFSTFDTHPVGSQNAPKSSGSSPTSSKLTEYHRYGRADPYDPYGDRYGHRYGHHDRYYHSSFQDPYIHDRIGKRYEEYYRRYDYPKYRDWYRPEYPPSPRYDYHRPEDRYRSDDRYAHPRRPYEHHAYDRPHHYPPPPAAAGRSLGYGQYRILGRDAQLRCDFGGEYPIGPIQWLPNVDSYRGRARVISDSSRESILEIRDFSPQDFGLYSCSVDVQGRTSRSGVPERVHMNIYFEPDRRYKKK